MGLFCASFDIQLGAIEFSNAMMLEDIWRRKRVHIYKKNAVFVWSNNLKDWRYFITNYS